MFLRAGERPATPLICRFIDDHKARFGVAPICRILSGHGCEIAAGTYYAWRTRAPSKRELWDMTITELLAGFYEPDEHGRRKPESVVWGHQDVGPPTCNARASRWPLHRGTADARQRRARALLTKPGELRTKEPAIVAMKRCGAYRLRLERRAAVARCITDVERVLASEGFADIDAYRDPFTGPPHRCGNAASPVGADLGAVH